MPNHPPEILACAKDIKKMVHPHSGLGFVANIIAKHIAPMVIKGVEQGTAKQENYP